MTDSTCIKGWLSLNPSDGEIVQNFEQEKQYYKQIGYFRDTKAEEWLGHLYVDLILDGKVPATDTVKLACSNFKWRLENQGSKEWPYFWDERKAFHFVQVMESHLTVGADPLVLQPHQHLISGEIQGWVDGNGVYAITEVQSIMGRGNAKTTLVMMIILYRMLYDRTNKYHARMLAGTKNVTKDIFKVAHNVVNSGDSWFRDRFLLNSVERVDINPDVLVKRKGKVIQPYKHSSAKIDVGTTKEAHGLELSVIYIDELHTMDTNKNFPDAIATLKRSQIKVPGSLTVYTSTRNKGISNLLETAIRESTINLKQYKTQEANKTELAYLYYTTTKDDLYNLGDWLKSNPNLFCIGNPLKLIKDFLKYSNNKELEGAKEYFTQQFNMLEASVYDNFIGMETLLKNNGKYNRQDLKGKKAYIGVDLNVGGDDFGAVVAIVPELIEGKPHVYLESKSFITRDVYEKKLTLSNYYPNLKKWVEDGSLVVVDQFDYSQNEIEQYILELIDFYNVGMVGYDRRGFSYLKSSLESKRPNVKLKPIAQNGEGLTESIAGMRDLFKEGLVNFNVDNMFSYYLKNAELVRNGQDLRLSKPTSRSGDKTQFKIDGAAAMIDAYAVFLEDGGFQVLSNNNSKVKLTIDEQMLLIGLF